MATLTALLGWQDQAACRHVDVNLFFPDDLPTSEQEAAWQTTAAVCAGCPVRPACLEYADRRDERHGTWGGLTEDERRLAKRRRQRAAAKELVAS
jgi:WhiB family redox-sensing transcriptional regulator